MSQATVVFLSLNCSLVLLWPYAPWSLMHVVYLQIRTKIGEVSAMQIRTELCPALL